MWMWFQISNVFLLGFILHVSCERTVEDMADATKYLKNYGYLSLSSSSFMDGTVVTKALEKYQKFMGISPTGTLCNATIKMMNMPRCGVADFSEDKKSSRFVVVSRWETKNLRYKIKNYPSYLSRKLVDETIQAAFDIWADHTDLTFTRVESGRVHIGITFNPIDGDGKVLAYAYFPPGGNANFDSYENWRTADGYDGYNLLEVAAHEFGHSLGLDHSRVYSALMWPNYKSANYVQLDRDDITAIQYLYGNKRLPKPPSSRPAAPEATTILPRTTTTTSNNEEKDICVDSSVDAVLDLNGETFAFKGRHYWKIVNYRLVGAAQFIKNRWQELEGNLDAAMLGDGNSVYFFKEEYCWKYDVEDVIMPGYPRLIKDEFEGIPSSLDAAMRWGNGHMYFFKGDRFWKYCPINRKSNDYDIGELKGLSGPVDAAMKHANGYIYFFKGDQYYRFDESRFAVVEGFPRYPRSTATWWLGCASNSVEDYNPHRNHNNHYHHHSH